MQNIENNGLHETYFLRAYVLKPKDHKYFATPPANDYLLQRQRGSLEGLAENMSRYKTPAANTSYTRTGTYDIASKLSLYNPVTSVNVDLYSPKINPYQKEKDQYQI